MIKVALDDRHGGRTWGVVRQVDHARLAFDLAERSVLLETLPPAARSEALCAIDRHDDGWQERDLAVEIDQVNGRPRSFDEMTDKEAIDIWGRSIDRARGFGLLSAWMVAGHFSRLARLRQDSDTSIRWAVDMDAKRAGWLGDWCAEDGDDQMSSIALTALRLFDSLSLYVIGVGDEPQRELTLPDGRSAIVTRNGGGVYSANPWFFTHSSFSLRVTGVRVVGTDIIDAWQPTITMMRSTEA